MLTVSLALHLFFEQDSSWRSNMPAVLWEGIIGQKLQLDAKSDFVLNEGFRCQLV